MKIYRVGDDKQSFHHQEITIFCRYTKDCAMDGLRDAILRLNCSR